MTEGIKLPDSLRVVGGPVLHIGGSSEANLENVNFGAGIDLRFRPFNSSREARDKFSIEGGPSFDNVSDTRRSTNILFKAGLIYKADPYFGAGIYGGAGVKLAKVDGGIESLGTYAITAEIHIYHDSIGIGGGIMVAGGGINDAVGVAQVWFDAVAIMPFFAIGS